MALLQSDREELKGQNRSHQSGNVLRFNRTVRN